MSDALLQAIGSEGAKKAGEAAMQFLKHSLGPLAEISDRLLGGLPGMGHNIFTEEAKERKNKEAAELPKKN